MRDLGQNDPGHPVFFLKKPGLKTVEPWIIKKKIQKYQKF